MTTSPDAISPPGVGSLTPRPQPFVTVPLAAVLDDVTLRPPAGVPGLDDVRIGGAAVADDGALPEADLDRCLLVVPGTISHAAALIADAAARGVSVLVLADLPDGQLATCRDAAAAAGLPVLTTDAVTAQAWHARALRLVLHEQSLLLDRIDRVHRMIEQSVLTGGSLDELADHLAVLMDGAVMVTDTDGRVLVTSSTADAELDNARRHPCFDASGRLVVEEQRFGVTAEPTVGGSRAMVRIVAANTDLGRLVAFASDRVMVEQDVTTLERAAMVAALAITRSQAVSAVESKYRAEFLRDALAGRAGRRAEAIAHARSLGWDIDRPMVVVVAETDEDDQQTARPAEEIRALQDRFTRAWVRSATTRDATTPVMGFSQEVVTLFPIEGTASRQDVVEEVTRIVTVVRGLGGGGRRTFCTGISQTVTSVDALPRAYEEALTAVTVGRQIHGSSAITHFDDLGTYRLLALIPDTDALHRFVRDTLGDLALDTPEAAEHRRTLGLLIDTNMNVAESARRLFIHYNTLRYRIGRLEQLLGPFVTDAELRMTLAMALRVHGMRGLARPR